MTGRNPYVVVCIPAFNDAKNIAEIVKSAKDFASEVIVCDDGSSDYTDRRATDAGAVVLKHQSHEGYGASIKTLFKVAKTRGADIAITLDPDSLTYLDQIPSVIKPIAEDGYDICIGSRYLPFRESSVSGYINFRLKAASRIADNVVDVQSGFRAYGKNAIKKLEPTTNGIGVQNEILTKAHELKLAITEVPITVGSGIEKGPGQNVISKTVEAAPMTIRDLSIHHPFLLFGLPGLALLIFAGIYGKQVIELYLASQHIPFEMMLLTVGATVAGIALLLCSVIFFAMAAIMKQRFRKS